MSAWLNYNKSMSVLLWRGGKVRLEKSKTSEAEVDMGCAVLARCAGTTKRKKCAIRQAGEVLDKCVNVRT